MTNIPASLAAQGYAKTRPATDPTPQAGAGETLNRVAGDFAQTLQQGDEVAQAAMTGKADSQSLVQALSQSQLAIETAVAVRDKVVEAYQEILRMPV